MIEGILGIIDKMRIEVFPSKDFTESEIKSTIFVQINPENYSINTEVEFCEGQPMGATSQDLKYNKIGSEEVTFDFIFDSSGILPPAKIKEGPADNIPLTESLIDVLKPAIANPFEQAETIEEELEDFKKLLAGYDGDIHQPNYLRLLWGSFVLKCRLVSINIEYKLFRRDGRPIRANAVCKFKRTQSTQEMQEQQNNRSPDVTHEKIVTQHDRLTLMAERTYDKNQYYIDTARVNNLLSFRELTIGEPLLFPPIK